MFFHRVNDIEHNIKQNVYTGMYNLSYTSMTLYIKTVTLKNDVSSEITKFQKDIFFKEHF